MFLAAESVLSASLQCGRSVGYAKIWDGDIQSAYSQSKNVALRSAVEASVGLFVSSKSEISNFAEIRDKIYTFSEGFVKNYTLIAQELVDSATVKSELNVCVTLGKLESKLSSIKALADELGYPQIGILINSKGCISDSSLFYQFSNLFVKSGIPSSILKIADTHPKSKFNQFDIILEISVKNQDLIGTRIPYAKTTLEDFGYQVTNMELEIAGYWRDTNEIIAHKVYSGNSVSNSFCSISSFIPIEKQQDLIQSITDDLLINWNKSLQNGRILSLTAQMPSSKIIQFQDMLEGTAEIKKITFLDSIAKFHLLAHYSGHEFARRLISISKTRKDTLVINEITFNTVSLKWNSYNDND
tara:strand:+ start:5090 stop:6160 length:1071 start_codon:yes stop_codon:yes gene_type:complete